MPLSLPLPLFCSLGCGMCGFFLVDIAAMIAMMHTASHRLKEKKKKELGQVHLCPEPSKL